MSASEKIKLNWPGAKMPESYILGESSLLYWDSDTLGPQPTIAEIEAVELPQVPAVTEVTRYQIRTWLVLNYGPSILTQIDQMLAAITDETQRVLAQIAWESATVIRLTDPLTLQFGTALGMTEQQMADAFEAASQIGV